MHATPIISTCIIASVALVAETSAEDLHKLLAAEVFHDNKGNISGICIPGSHTGFSPNTSTPPDLRTVFDESHPHPNNDSLLIAFWQPRDLDCIIGLRQLKWVKYCGSTSRFLPASQMHRMESERLAALLSALKNNETVHAIAIYDSSLPTNYLMKIMQLPSIKTILLVGCVAANENEEYSQIPETRVTLPR